MTYKQIETSREIRLWIGQLVVPTLTLAATALAIPEVRETIARKFEETKAHVKQKKIKIVKK